MSSDFLLLWKSRDAFRRLFLRISASEKREFLIMSDLLHAVLHMLNEIMHGFRALPEEHEYRSMFQICCK